MASTCGPSRTRSTSVDSAGTTPDGSLVLAFEQGSPRETFLTVAGTPHALAVDTPWQFEDWTEVR